MLPCLIPELLLSFADKVLSRNTWNTFAALDFPWSAWNLLAAIGSSTLEGMLNPGVGGCAKSPLSWMGDMGPFNAT